jgi:hypothetical protein
VKIIELLPYKHKFCSVCIRSWIIAQMQRGKFSENDLACLFDKCSTPLPQDLIRLCLTPSESSELIRLKRLNETHRNPNLMFCTNEQCDQIIERPILNVWGYSECSKCKMKVCLDCGQEHHDNATSILLDLRRPIHFEALCSLECIWLSRIDVQRYFRYSIKSSTSRATSLVHQCSDISRCDYIGAVRHDFVPFRCHFVHHFMVIVSSSSESTNIWSRACNC